MFHFAQNLGREKKGNLPVNIFKRTLSAIHWGKRNRYHSICPKRPPEIKECELGSSSARLNRLHKYRFLDVSGKSAHVLYLRDDNSVSVSTFKTDTWSIFTDRASLFSLFRQCGRAWQVTRLNYFRVLISALAERRPTSCESLTFGTGPLVTETKSNVGWFVSRGPMIYPSPLPLKCATPTQSLSTTMHNCIDWKATDFLLVVGHPFNVLQGLSQLWNRLPPSVDLLECQIILSLVCEVPLSTPDNHHLHHPHPILHSLCYKLTHR